MCQITPPCVIPVMVVSSNADLIYLLLDTQTALNQCAVAKATLDTCVRRYQEAE